MKLSLLVGCIVVLRSMCLGGIPGPLDTAWWADANATDPPSNNLTNDLLFYLDLEENDGADRINSVNPDTYSFPATGVPKSFPEPGKLHDWGARFAGYNEGYLSYTNNEAVYTNFTYNLWYKHITTTNHFLGGVWKVEGGADNTWYVWVNNSNEFCVTYYSSSHLVLSMTNSATINDGNWHMLTLSYEDKLESEATFILYVDYQYLTSSILLGWNTFNTPETMYPFNIGDAADPPQFASECYIDGVAFWTNRTLNATEIQYLYNSGSGAPYPFTQ